MTPFDFVNAINSKTKKNIISTDDDPRAAEKSYVPYIVNKTLSYFPETVLYANEMNRRKHLDHKPQFDYLLNTIRPGKRFAKWIKQDDGEVLELVKQYYQFNDEKARQAIPLLSKEQISMIKRILTSGVEDEHIREFD